MAAVLTRRRALTAAAVLTLSACDALFQAPAFKAIDITGAAYAQQLSLSDVDGRPRTLADFVGKVVVVFFGYTQCPDICPTALAEIAAAKERLGADGARVVGVLVSVDP